MKLFMVHDRRQENRACEKKQTCGRKEVMDNTAFRAAVFILMLSLRMQTDEFQC